MKKILHFLDEYLEEVVMTIMLILMAVIMGVQVLSRYAFGMSLSWSEEVTRYLMTTIESGQVSPACGIPMYYIQSAPLICFALCAFRIAQRWILEWRSFLHGEEKKQ